MKSATLWSVIEVPYRKLLGEKGEVTIKRIVLMQFVTRGRRRLSNVASNSSFLTNTVGCLLLVNIDAE